MGCHQQGSENGGENVLAACLPGTFWHVFRPSIQPVAGFGTLWHVFPHSNMQLQNKPWIRLRRGVCWDPILARRRRGVLPEGFYQSVSTGVFPPGKKTTGRFLPKSFYQGLGSRVFTKVLILRPSSLLRLAVAFGFPLKLQPGGAYPNQELVLCWLKVGAPIQLALRF